MGDRELPDGTDGYGTQDIGPNASPSYQAALGVLLLSLKSLSQRALVAIADLTGLLLCASVWWLAQALPDSPSIPKLIGVGGYAAFTLTAIHLMRRSR